MMTTSLFNKLRPESFLHRPWVPIVINEAVSISVPPFIPGESVFPYLEDIEILVVSLAILLANDYRDSSTSTWPNWARSGPLGSAPSYAEAQCEIGDRLANRFSNLDKLVDVTATMDWCTAVVYGDASERIYTIEELIDDSGRLISGPWLKR